MQYNILLAEVLMAPFIKTELTEKDFFQEYALCYDRLVNRHNYPVLGDNQRNKNKRDYNMAYKNLLHFFSDDIRWGHIDDIGRFLDMFYSGQELSEHLDNGDIGSFYLKRIMDIARVFVTFRDGMVSLRSWSRQQDPILNNYNEFEKIELWNNITRTVNTDLFIAATYVNFEIDMEHMYNVPNLIYLADMPLKVILDKGVAETHIHAKAGISYQDIWKNAMTLSYDKCDHDLWYSTFFRIYAMIYLEGLPSGCSDFETYLFEKLQDGLRLEWFMDFLRGDVGALSKNAVEEFETGLRKKYPFVNPDGGDILFQTVLYNYSQRGTAADIILYYKILSRLQVTFDPFLFRCMMRYIRIKNHFFQDKIQRTVFKGLDYFQEFYNRATRLDGNIIDRRNYYYSIFEEQCRTGNLRVLEIKISPKVISAYRKNRSSIWEMKSKTLKQIQDIIYAYNSYITSQRESNANGEFIFPKLGIIFHFIKHEDSDNFNGITCTLNENLPPVECLNYNAMRKNYINYLVALDELLEEYPLLTDYIVGIDAASIENATEPWVFAPVFRTARKSRKLIPYSFEKRGVIQNIGFTYHVGEDFRHIISGLRHVDEVLDHFDYHSGDRLGHAIALGVDIDDWTSRYGMVAIPIMEYLENLLWMWQYAKSGNVGRVPENLEFKIMEIAHQIYGDEVLGIDIHLLWRVYQAKFEDVDKIITEKGSFITSGECELNERDSKDRESKGKWNFKKLLGTHYCPCYYEKYKKPIFVSTKENVDFYKDLQRFLVNKVECMGVYVETNPSSNAAIGDIPDVLNHPILRLNNRGLNMKQFEDSCVLTSINSDDPVVFSTFVENEMAYIYYSLINAGCKKEEVLLWIDKIRRHGIDSSFIKSNKSIDKMQEDFSEILKYQL